MRNNLSDADYEQVLSCIEGIHHCSSLDEFPQHVLGCLRQLIACDLSAYNEVNLVRKRMVVYFDSPQKGLEPLLETFGTYMHEHPVINYFDQSGDGQALMISDFLSTREYHGRDIYRNFYRHFNAEDQISFAVRVESGFMIGIAFNRHERTFTEKDRMRLNLVRPHVIQAYLRAAELAGQKEHKRDLEAALHKSGVGVISLDEQGDVLHATPGVFDRLSCYIPIPESDTPSIPETLRQWALYSHGKEKEYPYSVSHDLSRLTVRRVRNEDRILLLLTEDTGLAAHGALDRYRLTTREKEVLRWLAQGKTNPEIAAILNAAVGTVKLHVERIFIKMGVENRTSAALLARGAL